MNVCTTLRYTYIVLCFSPAGDDDMGPSLVIGALLVVPVVLLVIITVLVRLYHTGTALLPILVLSVDACLSVEESHT